MALGLPIVFLISYSHPLWHLSLGKIEKPIEEINLKRYCSIKDFVAQRIVMYYCLRNDVGSVQ